MPRLVQPAFSAMVCLAIALNAMAATTQSTDPVQRRADDVRAEFRADPGGYEKLFHPSFLKAVPANKLDPIFTEMFKKLGDCKSAEISERLGPRAGKINFLFQSAVVPGTISVDAGDEHLIDGLFVQAPLPMAKDLNAIVTTLKALPGKTTFLVVNFSAEKTETLASLNPDQPMAIGSTFKLYILSELVRQIEKGQRHWDDVVKLDAAAVSLPSGDLQAWPVGSPVTIHTLASLMISKSDNTATDNLLRVVGRENVEAMLEPAGNKHADQNKPFLSTLEMFKLHGIKSLGDAYIAADTAARRKMLANDIANTPVDISGIGPTPGPFEKIEWFASAGDLCRTMDYLRRHTESGPAAEARKILSINPGLQIDKSQFPIICYKGGSEVGVINLTYLVQSRTGVWYAMSASWNNPKAALDEMKLFEPLTQAFRLLP